MKTTANAAQFLADSGYVQLPALLKPEELDDVAQQLATSDIVDGDRRMLDREWCRVLAQVLRLRLLRNRVLPRDAVPVLMRAFNNPAGTGCGSAPHRDLYIPVAEQVEASGYRNWSQVQGVTLCQPPAPILESMLVLYLYLEPCSELDGPLQVYAGSQRLALEQSESVRILAQPGDALLMTPSVMHCATRSCSERARRTLSVLFGPPALPKAVRWFYG